MLRGRLLLLQQLPLLPLVRLNLLHLAGMLRITASGSRLLQGCQKRASAHLQRSQKQQQHLWCQQQPGPLLHYQ